MKAEPRTTLAATRSPTARLSHFRLLSPGYLVQKHLPRTHLECPLCTCCFLQPSSACSSTEDPALLCQYL